MSDKLSDVELSVLNEFYKESVNACGECSYVKNMSWMSELDVGKRFGFRHSTATSLLPKLTTNGYLALFSNMGIRNAYVLSLQGIELVEKVYGKQS